MSVVMPVWRPQPMWLRRAVGSVLAQTMADLELVIVEDPGGSSVRDALAGIDDSRVRVVTNAQRTSLVAQRNRGLVEARAALVAMLDADDIALPSRLALQVERFTEDGGLAVLGSAIELIDDRDQPIAVRRYPCTHHDILATMSRENPLAQSAVMARREILLAAGGYRFAIEHTGEDYELWSRLARGGARFANLADVAVAYRIHDGASKVTRLRASLRSTLWVKEQWWSDQMSVRGRLRRLAERTLLHVPPAWVTGMFLLDRRLRGRPSRARRRAP